AADTQRAPHSQVAARPDLAEEGERPLELGAALGPGADGEQSLGGPEASERLVGQRADLGEAVGWLGETGGGGGGRLRRRGGLPRRTGRRPWRPRPGTTGSVRAPARPGLPGTAARPRTPPPAGPRPPGCCRPARTGA